MHLLITLSLLLVLLAPRPAITTTYSSLEASLGDNFIRLLLDTDLAVQTPVSVIQTRDFTEIFVWDSSTIFVGAANYLLKINPDLEIETLYTVDYTGMPCTPISTYLDSCDNYFRVFLNIDDNLYTCYTNRANPVCLTLNPADLSMESSPPLFQPSSDTDFGYISPSLPALLYQRNFAIYLLDNSANPRLVTGSVYQSRERNRITVINPFDQVYDTTTFYYFEEDGNVVKFLFAASFARTAHNYVDGSNNNYIYFMFYEPSTKQLSGRAISQVARFCLEGPSEPNPTGNTGLEHPQMETFVKGELVCGNVFPSLIQDWLYVDTGGDFEYYVVFSSLDKGPQTSYLCKYSLNTIRSVMDTVKECTASTTLTSDSIPPITEEPLIGYAGALFTQLQRYMFEFDSITYEMIYVTLTNGSIIKYCLSCDTADQLVELIQVVPSDVINSLDNPDLASLDRLQLNGDYLLAGGYTGLYKVPLETCSVFGDDYSSCLGDPMCYYDLNARACTAVTAGSTGSSSMLHLTRPLPDVATCSVLTGDVIISTAVMTTNITVSWMCELADSVNVVITFSDGSSDVILMYDNSPGTQSADLPYINLTNSDILSFSIQPFITYNSIVRALPGIPLYAYVTYDVIQIAPPPSTSCTPLPPICTRPVCVDDATCFDFCPSVMIDCSEEFNNNPCAVGVSYSLNGGANIIVTDPSMIEIDYMECGIEGCLFQAYAYNTTTGENTIGSSYWLKLISPIDQYSPVLSVERTSLSTFTFSAYFAEFNSHTCDATAIITTPNSSPLILPSCSRTISAIGMLTGGESSAESSVEVFASQYVLPPQNLQLDLSKKSDRDECSYIADVIVSWNHPPYDISGGPPERYLIEGSACSLPIGSGVTVTGVQTYTCNDVTLSYNTQYTIYVTSHEPCFRRASQVTTLNSTTVDALVPAKPRGLGYRFTDTELVLIWEVPLCANSDGAIEYRVIVERSQCGNSTSIQIHNTTTSYTEFPIALSGSSIYEYNVTLRTKAGVLESDDVNLTIFSPVSSDFSCVDCRVDRIMIDSDLKKVECESTAACQNLVKETSVSLKRELSGSIQYYINSTNPGGCGNILIDFSPYVLDDGLYIVSIQHRLEHECSDAECTTEVTHAFLNYKTVVDNGIPAALSQGQSSTDVCQNDKAFIILVLAVIAILCAVGNFGFMIVAFCVFCIPRRKIFRCC